MWTTDKTLFCESINGVNTSGHPYMCLVLHIFLLKYGNHFYII